MDAAGKEGDRVGGHKLRKRGYGFDRNPLIYLVGFISNNPVLAQTAPLLLKAQRQYQETGEKQRLFTSFSYQAGAWTRPRRIIAKMEYAYLGRTNALWSPTSAAIPSSSMTTSTCCGAMWKTVSWN